jgi:hypothetical protein
MNKFTKVIEQIDNAGELIIGGYDNSISDGHITEMPTHSKLLDEIYDLVINFTTYEASTYSSPIKEIRFLTKEVIVLMIENYLNDRNL